MEIVPFEPKYKADLLELERIAIKEVPGFGPDFKTEDSFKVDPDFLLIAKEDNRAVGYLLAKKDEKKEGCMDLATLVIISEYRHRGIGSALVKEFMERMKKRGLKNVHLGAPRKDLICFYEKLGFTFEFAYMFKDF